MTNRSLRDASRILRVLPVLLAAAGLLQGRAEAIETGSSYNTTAPTDSDIAHWTTGWPSGGTTGWDYVGSVTDVNGAAAGVYLGNGWVITAAHIGVISTSTFTLGGTLYAIDGSSITSVGSSDLVMFQLASAPSLASLTLNTSQSALLGSPVVMIGEGGGGLSWGVNTVTAINQAVNVPNGPVTYHSTDFETAYGGGSFFNPNTHATVSYTNSAQLVTGDSGGADFIYVNGAWKLAGINEAVDNSNSYLIDLSQYATAIAAIDGVSTVPEPGTWGLVLGGAALLAMRGARRRLHP